MTLRYELDTVLVKYEDNISAKSNCKDGKDGKDGKDDSLTVAAIGNFYTYTYYQD